jgi:hypothetical protein
MSTVYRKSLQTLFVEVDNMVQEEEKDSAMEEENGVQK